MTRAKSFSADLVDFMAAQGFTRHYGDGMPEGVEGWEAICAIDRTYDEDCELAHCHDWDSGDIIWWKRA
jgi:hypothetical protein